MQEPYSVVTSEYGWSYLQCHHTSTALRQRTRSDGVAVFVEQCLTCGSQRRSVAKTSREVRALVEAIPFDESLKERWNTRTHALHEARTREREQKRQQEQSQRREVYESYLSSVAWRKKRAIVLDRAPAGLCEACGVQLATQVHHLTYEHLGNELLWELRAVCHDCHQRIHRSKDIGHD